MLKTKKKQSKDVGIKSNIIKYPKDVSEQDILNKIKDLNKDDNVSEF